jgi:class 3 adenylate cyclase
VLGLAARAEWHEERFSALTDETLAGAREVSIVLADLEGFTSFRATRPGRGRSDAELVLERLVPLMEHAGGEVHQIVGDELMVVFGKEGDTPDHAVRAARAALLLQRSAERVARDHADWPRFRVGVNSGEVLAGVLGGASGHRKHGVVGDVVNVAARLQAQAPVGSVLIGEATFVKLGSAPSSRPSCRSG